MPVYIGKSGVEFETQTHDRRLHPRHRPATRAAVWFDFGPVIGETCELKDISMSGFSVQCSDFQLPVFLGNSGESSLFCVLLMGEAYFGCMARMVMSPGVHAGFIGFRFEVVPQDSERLLKGLIAWMADRAAQQEDAAGA